MALFALGFAAGFAVAAILAIAWLLRNVKPWV